MPKIPTIFETCEPRPDVLSGATKDEQFAADLSQVVNRTAPKEYLDPKIFFSNTHPTRGIKDLLKAVLTRLSGRGGEIASILRLDTQFGGGKTHALIALVHAIRGVNDDELLKEFVDPDLIPRQNVRIAALDGENCDPADGLTLDPGLKAKTPWGELAYRLAGVEGFKRVQESDRKHVAPGAETLRELFGDQPVLIMFDEVSVYLRKAEKAEPGSSAQFAAFLQALIKAVETTSNVALVFTLAVGKDSKAVDAYRDEHDRAIKAFQEAETVAARKATLLNPTEEDETALILKRRLFAKYQTEHMSEIVDAYYDVWARDRGELPASVFDLEIKERFRLGYPIHPETIAVLTEKLSTLGTFQRTRGMLRLLARTVHTLWRDKPADATAIHPHHIDPSFGPIRDEITTRLNRPEFAPALKADIASVPGDAPSTAQELDKKFAPGSIHVHSYVARTVFLHTLAYGDVARGISAEHLKFSVCSPLVEPSFVEQARVRFIQESLFLDDHPGAKLRFMAEPNLTQVVRRRMDEIPEAEIRAELDHRIKELFSAPKSTFQLVPFAASPDDVDDSVGDGRPFLVLIHHDALSIDSDPSGLPQLVDEIYRYKSTDQKLRELRNNLVVVVADERLVAGMKDRVRRRLALQQLRKPDSIDRLAPYQQNKVNEDFEKSKLQIAESILHCYRHLFFPSNSKMERSDLPLEHAVIEAHNAGDSPGDGQKRVIKVLKDHHKLLLESDPPDSPTFVRDQTPLKIKGELSTLELRDEYRRAPKLSILASNGPLVSCIRRGIESGLWIYREGDQVWGPGDPAPSIRFSEDAFVHTAADASKKRLWPRPEPLVVTFTASPRTIAPGESAELRVSVSGGFPPYIYIGTHPELSSDKTTQTLFQCEVSPEVSQSYRVEVIDDVGKRFEAVAEVLVAEPGRVPPTPNRPDPPIPPAGASIPGGSIRPDQRVKPKPSVVSAEGPIKQALTELWEKARAAKISAVDRLEIKLFDPKAASYIHSAMATYKDASIVCLIELDAQLKDADRLKVEFTGSVERGSTIKSFVESQLHASINHDFSAVYTLRFHKPLSTDARQSDDFSKTITRFGAGEAYVEAQAAAAEEKA